MTPNNNPIEALLFDLGGVVINIDFERALRRWSSFSSLGLDELRKRFVFDTHYEQHERGEIDAAAYFQHLREVLFLQASDTQIAEAWNDIYTGEVLETVNHISRIRQKIRCYAFTNTNPTHQASWSSIYSHLVPLFEKIFVSSELGLRKPESAAFHAVAGAIQTELSSILFFDDAEENVTGAREVGMQAVLVSSPLNIEVALSRIGLV